MYVYSYYAADGTPLYIGQAKQVLMRFEQHRQNDDWMKYVELVTVRGPYPVEEVSFYEQFHITDEQPLYNRNSRYIDESDETVEDPYPVHHFGSVQDFEKYFWVQPDTYQRATHYFRKIDLEVLRALKYHLCCDFSKLVREAVEIGMREIASRAGHADIYSEVLEEMINGKVKPQKQSRTRRSRRAGQHS